jgi:hypothetical protein
VNADAEKEASGGGHPHPSLNGVKEGSRPDGVRRLTVVARME